jgi:hypothetical protein
MADSTASGLDAVPRRPLDTAAYEQRAREGPCFVCEMLAGNPNYPGHLVWTDDHAVAFLAKDPPLLGHTLVAPRAHREHVTADFGIEDYLARNAWCTRWEKRSAKSCRPNGCTS